MSFNKLSPIMKNLISLLIIQIVLLNSISGQFKVMSYNIRHNCGCSTCIIDKCGDNEKSVYSRINRIIHIIKSHKPEIIGLQEIATRDIPYLLKPLLSEYEVINSYNSSPRIILWKKDRFELKKWNYLMIDKEKKKSTAWVKLYDKVSDKSLLVFNNHWSPGMSTSREQYRLQTSKNLIKEIKKINTENLPVINIGDFNDEPNKPSIINLKKSFTPCYKTIEYSSSNNEKTYSKDFKSQPTRKIDYIFISSKLSCIGFYKDDIKFNKTFPSDHLPIISILIYK